MNKLTKNQKDEMATSLAVLALYDGGVSDGTIMFFPCISRFAHDTARLELGLDEMSKYKTYVSGLFDGN